MVGRGPGGGEDDGVDDVRDGTDAGARRGYDEGGLTSCTGGIEQAGVVARHDESDYEEAQDVEYEDADKDTPRCHGDVATCRNAKRESEGRASRRQVERPPTRIFGLGCCHGDALHAGKAVGGVYERVPVCAVRLHQ